MVNPSFPSTATAPVLPPRSRRTEGARPLRTRRPFPRLPSAGIGVRPRPARTWSWERTRARRRTAPARVGRTPLSRAKPHSGSRCPTPDVPLRPPGSTCFTPSSLSANAHIEDPPDCSAGDVLPFSSVAAVDDVDGLGRRGRVLRPMQRRAPAPRLRHVHERSSTKFRRSQRRPAHRRGRVVICEAATVAEVDCVCDCHACGHLSTGIGRWRAWQFAGGTASFSSS
jgi:hypothetical protein